MAERQLNDFGAQDRLAFFEAVTEGFDRAVSSAGGTVDLYYTIGGHIVCLQFAGSALLPYLEPALAHLRTAPVSSPHFTIGLFDSASSATKMPLLVDSLIAFLRYNWWERLKNRREIEGYNDDRIHAVFHLGPDILSVLDTESNRAVYWVEDAALIPYYETGYPLTTLLNWWLGTRDQYFAHAAAVGTAAGGVLLPGKGGSGKSTTTLTCLDSPLKILGDDYCIVGGDDPGCAYGLYNTIKLKSDEDVAHFPRIEPFISNPKRQGEEKAMIFLQDHFPDKMLKSFPVRAILIPQVAQQVHTEIKPAPAAAALKALAPSTLFQLAGNGQAAFQAIVRLVRNVPTFTIELGSDLQAIPPAIESFLAAEVYSGR